MRFATIRQAHQDFLRILEEVEGGETVVLIRHRRPVAVLRPYGASDAKEWEAAIEHIVGLMREGIPINGPVSPIATPSCWRISRPRAPPPAFPRPSPARC